MTAGRHPCRPSPCAVCAPYFDNPRHARRGTPPRSVPASDGPPTALADTVHLKLSVRSGARPRRAPQSFRPRRSHCAHPARPGGPGLPCPRPSAPSPCPFAPWRVRIPLPALASLRLCPSRYARTREVRPRHGPQCFALSRACPSLLDRCDQIDPAAERSRRISVTPDRAADRLRIDIDRKIELRAGFLHAMEHRSRGHASPQVATPDFGQNPATWGV
jgi:hypothetical protein